MFDAQTVAKVCGGTVKGDGNVQILAACKDSREIKEGDLYIAIIGENNDGNDYAGKAYENGAVCSLVSRDVDVPEGKAAVIVSDTRRALLSLAAYYRSTFDIKLVGVTGSVGKTTTKEMIHCALSSVWKTHKTNKNFNNDIGLPMTLLELNDTYKASVIEMGMSARGEISVLTNVAKPDVAVITNIGVSHIEHLKTQENILAAKLEILEGLPENGTVILNADDKFLSKQTSLPFKTVFYGLDNDCEVKGEVLSDNKVRVLGETIELSVPGKHNLLNACAAMAVARALGIPAADAARGISSFETDEIRQRLVKSPKGFDIICDWYNASPQSVSVALELLCKKEGRKIAVLADMLELGDFSKKCHEDIGIEAAERGVDMLFTYGKESKYMHEAAKEKGLDAKHFDSKDELSASLLNTLQKGDTVLIKGSHSMKMQDIYDKIMG
ncbi:MAG: UDP-N-acetylmuramoyl-tripeptide--D-alanyl-D-alanine ligase [Clostridia bacterium]|nr:UDP-N-acetylmuramoyl-tripeptide--D-alanyl-D-alanine ligase [Clostridia bacterium]